MILGNYEEKNEMDFSKAMNPPEGGFDGRADIKTFPDGGRWAVCPWCGKKALKILPETMIRKLEYQCRGSNCKKIFSINAH